MVNSFDLYLIQQQKSVFGLNAINTEFTNTTILGSVTINTNLNILGNSVLNSISVLSNLNVNDQMIFGSLSVNNLNISGNVNLGSTILKSNLNVPNIAIFNNTVNCDNISITNGTIIQNNISINSIFSINNNIISGNSIISSNIYVSGLASFQGLILNNLTISAATLLQGNVSTNTIISNFNNSLNNLNNNNNISINSNLNVSNITTFQNNITINSLLISGSASISSSNNLIPINSLNVNNDIIISGNIKIYSWGDPNNTNYSLFNIDGISDPTLKISGLTVFNSNVSIVSNLSISNNCILNNVSTMSDLKVLNNAFFNNISIISSLKIKKNININSLLICNNLITESDMIISGYTNLISDFKIDGNIINTLPEFFDNTSAINGGIPLWGFYRTGGIIKIRLNEIPPIMTLIGNNLITLNVGDSYIESGVNAMAVDDGNISVYLISFVLNNFNLLQNPIFISNSMESSNNINLAIKTNQLVKGTYILTYKATDSSDNTSFITRTIIYF